VTRAEEIIWSIVNKISLFVVVAAYVVFWIAVAGEMT
jgi:hypothetical protein